jgi:hypothetical protein
MNKSLLNKFDPLSLSLIGFALLLSLYSFYFFISNKIYLIGSDAFYYISIADSILEYGEMRDITAIPSFPVKSPQNGIVFVHVILSLFGLGAKGRILTIVVINYLLYLSGVYPLYKIARWSGLRKGLPLIALLSVYLGAWHIYRINLLAINDGIFNSLTLWLIYLVIKFIREMDALESISLYKSAVKEILILSLIVMVLVQFRLNAALVIGSALISALAVRDYRASLFLVSMCVLLLVSFLAVYLFIEVVRLENVGERYFFPMFRAISISSIKLQLWKILPRLVAGLSGLTNPLATLIFAIFPLSMMYYGIRGLIDRNFSQVFIAGTCLTGLWFTMSFQNARVIWYIFPLIYLILLSFKSIRFAGYAFVLLVFLQSLQQFYIGFPRGSESKLWLHIYDQSISLPDNSLLSSHNRRHPYFFLETRNYLGSGSWREVLEEIKAPGKFMPRLTWDLVNEYGSLFVMGNSTYIDSTFTQVSEMSASYGYKIQTKPLTPDLDKFKGWALVEFQITEDDPL